MLELLSDDALTTREKIFALETIMKACPDQLELPVINYFSHGVYARELHIPAGVMLVGEIHKFENLNILSKGEMTVVTDDGTKRVKAPFTVVSPPGTKRAAIAHTDCIWTTIHGTFETDVDKIKAYFIAKDEEDYLLSCEKLSCGQSNVVNIADYYEPQQLQLELEEGFA